MQVPRRSTAGLMHAMPTLCSAKAQNDNATSPVQICLSRGIRMNSITFENGTIQVDPAIVAKGLRLDVEALRTALRDGSVTSLCEKGMEQDAGRFRLTFFSPTRRLRLIVDEGGAVLQTSTADYARKPVRSGSAV